MVIKRLKQCITKLEKDLLVPNLKGEERKTIVSKLEVLRGFYRFVECGTWLSSKKLKIELQVYLDSGSVGLKTVYGMGDAAIRNKALYLNKVLTPYVSEQLVDMVMLGKIKEAVLRFSARTDFCNLNAVFNSDLLTLVGVEKVVNEDVVLDCEDELQLLRDFSVRNLNSRLGSVRKNVVQNLLTLMQSKESKFDSYKVILYQYFVQGVGNAKDVSKVFKRLHDGLEKGANE